MDSTDGMFALRGIQIIQLASGHPPLVQAIGEEGGIFGLILIGNNLVKSV